MKAVSLDLGPRRRLHGLGWAALIAAIIGAVLIERRLTAEMELDSWQRKWEKIDERFSHRSVEAHRPELRDEIAKANRVIARLGVPWGSLFAAIDTTITDNVALLSVEPDDDHGSVRIAAEAKDRLAMLDYARAIQRSSILMDGHITSYQINNQDPQKPVRFAVVARWRGSPAFDREARPSE